MRKQRSIGVLGQVGSRSVQRQRPTECWPRYWLVFERQRDECEAGIRLDSECPDGVIASLELVHHGLELSLGICPPVLDQRLAQAGVDPRQAERRFRLDVGDGGAVAGGECGSVRCRRLLQTSDVNALGLTVDLRLEELHGGETNQGPCVVAIEFERPAIVIGRSRQDLRASPGFPPPSP